MPVLDLEKLLQPISPEQPCGENLEYDPEVVALDALARGKSEQQFGDTVIPGEEPDWREVRRAALALLERTADLRIGVHLARAMLNTDGLAGFADVAGLARGWLEQRWEHVHPQLDPEDGDATMRVNAIAALAHPETVLKDLRLAPLVRSRNVGSFSLRDCQMAAGDIPAPEGVTPPDAATIEAAFADVPVEELQATADAIAAGIAALEATEAALGERLGAGMGADLSGLTQLLRAAERIVGPRLAARGGTAPVAAGEPAAAAAGQPAAAGAASGEIRSREDVARLLDRACAYFRQHEPSSPVPLLLERAKRLIFMDFKGILQDLAPSGVAEFEVVSGRSETAQTE
jgi:type VI secretion system protein ImpA